MHNGFVRVDNEKMSKSLGNFFTIREVLERYDAEVVRFFILRAHYRSPLNYSDAHLDDAKRSLDSLYFALRDVPPATVDIDWSNDFAARFALALNEDFDSHGAIAVLFELAGEVNRQRSAGLSGLLKALAGVIGLLEREPTGLSARRRWCCAGWMRRPSKRLIAERCDGQEIQEFRRSRPHSGQLKAADIVLDDSPQGTILAACLK